MFRKIYSFFINSFNNFIQKFIQRNTDLIECYEYLQRIDKNTLLVISRNETEYLTKNLSTSRICWVLLVRIFVIFHTLRFGVSALVNKQSVREFLFDLGFMVGPPRLISSAITAVSLAIVAIGLISVYQELTNQLHFFNLAHIITTKQDKYPLNSQNHRKYTIRCNLMARYLLPIAYMVMVVFMATFHFILYLNILLNFGRKMLFIHKIYNIEHIMDYIQPPLLFSGLDWIHHLVYFH